MSMERVKEKYKPDQGYAFHTRDTGPNLGDAEPLFYGLSKEDIDTLFETVKQQNEQIEILQKSERAIEYRRDFYKGKFEEEFEKSKQKYQRIEELQKALKEIANTESVGEGDENAEMYANDLIGIAQKALNK